MCLRWVCVDIVYVQVWYGVLVLHVDMVTVDIV